MLKSVNRFTLLSNTTKRCKERNFNIDNPNTDLLAETLPREKTKHVGTLLEPLTLEKLPSKKIDMLERLEITRLIQTNWNAMHVINQDITLEIVLIKLIYSLEKLN